MISEPRTSIQTHPMQTYLIHNDILGATTYGSSVHKGRRNLIQNRDRGLVSSSSSVSTARRFQKPLAPAYTYPPSSLRRAHRRGGLLPPLAAPFPIEAASSLLPRWLVPQNEPSNEANEGSPEQLDPPSPSSSFSPKDEITQQKPILSIGGGGRYFFWYLVSGCISRSRSLLTFLPPRVMINV